MIRIISGKFKGCRLKVPDGRNVRPTTDRVREALFGMLEHRIVWPEMVVLDLLPEQLAAERSLPNYTLKTRRPELYAELVKEQVQC